MALISEGRAGENAALRHEGMDPGPCAVRAGGDKGRVAVIAVTERGVSIALNIASSLGGADLYVPDRLSDRVGYEHHAFSSPLAQLMQEVFPLYRQLVLIVALGAAVRLLAPLVKDKRSDPGVVVVDERGWNVISLLSGHLGGANTLSRELSAALGAHAVITTATDLQGLPALDLIINERGWWCEDHRKLPGLIAAMLEGEEILLFQEGSRDLLEELESHGVKVLSETLEGMAKDRVGRWKVVVSDREHPELSGIPEDKLVRIRPRELVLGIGCRKGVRSEEIEAAVLATLRRNHLSPGGISLLATAEGKRGEAGLAKFAAERGLPIRYLPNEELERVEAPSPSNPVARQALGVSGVCERAAQVASGNGFLLVPKTKFERVTVAVAARRKAESREAGKLWVVGIGPGDPELISPRARKVLLHSDMVVGYSTYVRQVEETLNPTTSVSFSMGEEVERVRWAVGQAAEGRKVCLVSGGDPGIYGMAGALGDLLLASDEVFKELRVEVIPGIPALCAAAAQLGAPLSNDFAVISLSDYLTPWEVIEERLRSCARSDMVIVLYNPSSSKRRTKLACAAQIVMEYRGGETPVGIVRNASRAGQVVSIHTLSRLPEIEVGMDSLVVVGNSTTRVRGGLMITPRGYRVS